MPDWEQRLSAVAADHGLDDTERRRLGVLVRRIAADEHAPTAVRIPRDIVDVHVADSLAGSVGPPIATARTIVDLGSGAGFPGLPLAVANPAAHVDLVESAARKVTFLREVVAEMGLENVAVIHARAEAWPEGLSRADAVVVRAVDSLPVLVEYAAPLLGVGGHLVAWKGRRDHAEESNGDAAAAQVGLDPVEIRPVKPYPGSRDRHLHIFVKRTATPAGFPRAPGRARKRPLR